MNYPQSPAPKEEPTVGDALDDAAPSPAPRAADPAPAPKAPVNLDAARLLRDAENAKARAEARAARQAEIRGICPEDLLPFLEDLFLDNPDIDFEDARRALVDARSAKFTPVGTPEPEDTTPNPAPRSLDSGDLYKSITGI